MKKYAGAILLFVTIGVVSNAIYVYYHKKKRNVIPKEINEVIMFSYGANVLKKSKYSKCVITESMERLMYYLSTPRHTLDICMYIITNSDLTNTILKLNLKGVKIRLIIDADMAYSSGSSIRKFEKNGIQVRWMKSTNLMHHKFCLIDSCNEDDSIAPVVIMGSLNWTNQALNGNWEDVVVTSQKHLVLQYRTEFERLWGLFKPIVGL